MGVANQRLCRCGWESGIVGSKICMLWFRFRRSAQKGISSVAHGVEIKPAGLTTWREKAKHANRSTYMPFKELVGPRGCIYSSLSII